MDERVTKCLDAIGGAIKELIASSKNETEMIGLVAMFFAGWADTYKKAIDEGVEELEKREEEGN